MSKKVLVTGANGQLGREIRVATKRSCDNYIFTDVEELDITNRDAVAELVDAGRFDVIVNCAAYTNVDMAEEEVSLADQINRQAVSHLAEAANATGATFIHISTDYVFDGKAYTPYQERAATSPLGVYGKTKLAGERLITVSGCKYIIIRTSWLYSRWGKNFVKSMLQLTEQNERLKVVFDQVGSPTFAGDLAEAIISIISHDKLSEVGTYHYSNEGTCSWYDLAHEICVQSHHSCIIEPIHSSQYPSKVPRPHYSVLDKTKFKTTFGTDIPHWTTSLKALIKEMKGE
ncbi:MAG: dTDP-4-dehydrorhamnose reductase [Rikenellaceae bacterium]